MCAGDSEGASARIIEVLQGYEPGPQGFEGQFSALHAALEAGTEIPVTLKSGRHVLETITAIYASAHHGKPVDLPISDGDASYASWRPKTAN